MITELSLYGIVDEIKEIENLLQINEGEIEISEEERLKQLAHMVQLKTDSCVGFINYQEDLIDMARHRMKILSDFIQARENKIENFENYIISCMEKLGVNELSGSFNKVKLRKPPEVLVIENETFIPAEFIKTTTSYSTDKTGLKKAIKDGLEVPGCRIGEGKKSLLKSLKTGK